MELEILEYNPIYLSDVLMLHKKAMDQVGAYKGDGPWDEDLKNITVHYENRSKFLLGFLENKLVAMGAFKYADHDYAEVKRMRVAPEYQGQGFGKIIYHALENEARKVKIEAFYLETSEIQIAAQALYKSVGFIEQERKVIDGFRCILYRKDLKQ